MHKHWDSSMMSVYTRDKIKANLLRRSLFIRAFGSTSPLRTPSQFKRFLIPNWMATKQEIKKKL
jgi:hypothetical protein